ncbi:DUF6210 family protein [Thermomonospora catenispora]|uniref:DUF6210 family protein n=1 Tax=Thermomonospora catenispora TaxID=2493090 RepID=UPI003BADB1BC
MAGAEGWLYVVVEAPTGVVYHQQYGGSACRQGRVEGVFRPGVRRRRSRLVAGGVHRPAQGRRRPRPQVVRRRVGRAAGGARRRHVPAP